MNGHVYFGESAAPPAALEQSAALRDVLMRVMYAIRAVRALVNVMRSDMYKCCYMICFGSPQCSGDARFCHTGADPNGFWPALFSPQPKGWGLGSRFLTYQPTEDGTWVSLTPTQLGGSLGPRSSCASSQVVTLFHTYHRFNVLQN